MDGAPTRDDALPGWSTLLAVVLAYAVCVSIATFPICLTLFSRFPCHRNDALQALWVMRWYGDCLGEGRLPYSCPDVQAPIGGHLGNWSPMHFQALLYLPLARVIGDDVVCYNLIWLGNLVFTGVGTFLLVWQKLRSRLCAFYGGLSAMLAAPVLLHAMGHLELITLGWLPLFLAAWMRWVDRPRWWTLAIAAGLYVLVAMSAGYFAVFTLVPAVLYVVHAALRGGVGAVPGWLWGRLGWFTLFVLATLPCLLIVFSAQIDARARGFSAPRPREEFVHYGTPVWGYLVPSSYHVAWQWLPVRPYQAPGLRFEVERCSYPGLVTLGLTACALLARAPLRRRRFWWALLGALVVLSFGARLTWGGLSCDLPAQWLYDWCPPFRQLRVPARFNLFAGVAFAVVASAGLAWLLGRVRQRAARVGIVAALSALALLDLSVTPNRTEYRELPAMPACYDFLRREAPDATLLEVPQFSSGSAADLHACCTWWQSQHHLRTSAGYSGFTNARHEGLVHEPSPFAATRLRDLGDWGTEPATVDVVKDVNPSDSAWLYLRVHGFTHVVVHDPPGPTQFPVEGIKARLYPGLLFAEGSASVYAADRLPPPERPTLLPTEGWRVRRLFWRKGGEPNRVRTAPVGAEARLAVWNPDAATPLRFTLEAVAVREPRRVRLLADGVEVGCWQVSADAAGSYTSPPFHFPAGRCELALVSDGEAVAARGEEAGWYETTPTSLWVTGVRLRQDWEAKK